MHFDTLAEHRFSVGQQTETKAPLLGWYLCVFMAATIGFCWQTWGGESRGDLHTSLKAFCWNQESITQALLLLAAVSKMRWSTAFLLPWDIVYSMGRGSGSLDRLFSAVCDWYRPKRTPLYVCSSALRRRSHSGTVMSFPEWPHLAAAHTTQQTHLQHRCLLL